MTSVQLQKKRDSWERRVRIAYAQLKSMKNNFHIYQEESTRVLERYKKWLEDHNVEPLMDFNEIKI